MEIVKKALEGHIVFVPSNGSPRIITSLPAGMSPHYSGAHVVLAGDQTKGDFNVTMRSQIGDRVKGDVVVLSQDTWHALTKK